MNQLQTFKQKGRLLRAHLEKVFKRPVTLSEAYEALAAAEGTTWNVLSAQLAASSVSSEKVQVRSDVSDVDLVDPANTDLMHEVCQAAWELAKQHWAATVRGGRICEYVIEYGDALQAMADCGVIPTKGTQDEPEYVTTAVQGVLYQLEVLGYELHARYLAEGKISPNEPMLGITTFGQLEIGDWFRNVHSCTLYRKESKTTVRAYRQLDEKPFSQVFQMGEDAVVRVVKRSESFTR